MIIPDRPERLVIENGKVVGLRCIKLREGAPEANGRRKLIEIPGTEFVIPCSNVNSAIGQRIDQSIFEQKDNIPFRQTRQYFRHGISGHQPSGCVCGR